MALLLRNSRQLLVNLRFSSQVQQIRKPVPSVRHLLKINYQLDNLVERETKQQNKQRKINSELQAFRYCHVGIIAAKEPFQVEVVEGKKYSCCKCGLSKKQPFCDGRHKATPIRPIRFVAEQSSTEVFLCGCKQTGSPPYCDGTHATESVQSADIHT